MSESQTTSRREYRYVGTVPQTGKRLRGTVIGNDEQDAIERASQATGLKAVAVKPVGKLGSLGSGSKGSERERLEYLRSLSLSLSTGASSRIALQNAALHLKDGSAVRTQAESLAALAEGQSISDAFAAQSDIWGEDVAQIVRAGQTAGNLGEILETLVQSKENEAEIRKQVRKTLRKPLPAVLGLIGLIFVSLTTILPRIVDTFSGALDVELPTITALAMSIGARLGTYGPVAFLLMAFISVSIYMASHSERYGLSLATFRLQMPLFGPVIRGGAISRVADVMAMALSANARPYEVCGWAAESVSNLRIKKALRDAQSDMLGGTEFSEAISQQVPTLPHEFRALAAQSSLGLSDPGAHWRRYANAIKKDTEHKADRVNERIELFIPLAIMIVVGFIGAAIMLPQYNAVSQLMQNI